MLRHRSYSISSAVFAAALTLGACADDGSSDEKGEVDVDALTQTGAVVTISGNLGTVDVPFSTAVPEVDHADVQSALSLVVLTVSNTTTGESFNLTEGTLVETEPAAANEYTWALNGDRTVGTLTFFNQVASGQSLQVDGGYNATFEVLDNDLVEAVAPTSLAVTVQ
jgi:hypothetical protein